MVLGLSAGRAATFDAGVSKSASRRSGFPARGICRRRGSRVHDRRIHQRSRQQRSHRVLSSSRCASAYRHSRLLPIAKIEGLTPLTLDARGTPDVGYL